MTNHECRVTKLAQRDRNLFHLPSAFVIWISSLHRGSSRAATSRILVGVRRELDAQMIGARVHVVLARSRIQACGRGNAIPPIRFRLRTVRAASALPAL